jgi:hypothetical protein
VIVLRVNRIGSNMEGEITPIRKRASGTMSEGGTVGQKIGITGENTGGMGNIGERNRGASLG